MTLVWRRGQGPLSQPWGRAQRRGERTWAAPMPVYPQTSHQRHSFYLGRLGQKSLMPWENVPINNQPCILFVWGSVSLINCEALKSSCVCGREECWWGAGGMRLSHSQSSPVCLCPSQSRHSWKAWRFLLRIFLNNQERSGPGSPHPPWWWWSWAHWARFDILPRSHPDLLFYL